MSILQRINDSQRSAAKLESSHTALGVVGRLNDALESAEREVEKYRTEVKGLESRLMRLQDRYDKLSQDKDSVMLSKAAGEAQHATLQTKLDELTQTNKTLHQTVKLEQATLKSKAAEYTASSAGHAQEVKQLQAQLNAEQQKSAKLEGQVAELTKRVNAKPPERKTTKVPKVVPEFVIDNVKYGGPENRPISATIKPVRAS